MILNFQSVNPTSWSDVCQLGYQNLMKPQKNQWNPHNFAGWCSGPQSKIPENTSHENPNQNPVKTIPYIYIYAIPILAKISNTSAVGPEAPIPLRHLGARESRRAADLPRLRAGDGAAAARGADGDSGMRTAGGGRLVRGTKKFLGFTMDLWDLNMKNKGFYQQNLGFGIGTMENMGFLMDYCGL